MADVLPDGHQLMIARHADLLWTLVGLLALTALSFALSFVSLGALAAPAAYGIAGLKVGLVGFFFMELRDAPASIRWTAFVAPLMVAIFVFFVVTDVVKR